VNEFGDTYVRDGRIDRPLLGELIFRDESARHRLNAIVHPLVREWMAAKTAEAALRDAGVVVQAVPLLFENGLERLYSTTVIVYVPEEMQLRRLVEGRGLSRDRARGMIAAQMPIDEKRNLAHHVIDNSGSVESTRKKVERLWEQSLRVT
jgi:dephospho-CoA kinase